MDFARKYLGNVEVAQLVLLLLNLQCLYLYDAWFSNFEKPMLETRET